MNSDFVVLASYDNPVEANIVKGRLESENIYCFLAGEHFVGLNPLYSNLAGGIRIFVKPEDLDLAKGILINDLEDYKKITICRYCGSNKVHFVSSTKGLKNLFTLVASTLFSILTVYLIPIAVKKVYKCDDCGAEDEMKDV